MCNYREFGDGDSRKRLQTIEPLIIHLESALP